jgi:thiosulfate dehydrogenase [quinone] large subunit
MTEHKLRNIPYKKISLGGLTILRALLGVIFIGAGTSKLVSDDFGREMMIAFLAANESMMFDFYRVFIDGVVLQLPSLFAVSVAFGELALGLSLVLGSNIKYSTVLGVFMLTNFMFAKGVFLWSFGGDQLFVALLALMFATKAGAYWGLDGYWSNKRARVEVNNTESNQQATSETDSFS